MPEIRSRWWIWTLFVVTDFANFHERKHISSKTTTTRAARFSKARLHSCTVSAYAAIWTPNLGAGRLRWYELKPSAYCSVSVGHHWLSAITRLWNITLAARNTQRWLVPGWHFSSADWSHTWKFNRTAVLRSSQCCGQDDRRLIQNLQKMKQRASAHLEFHCRLRFNPAKRARHQSSS